MSLRTSGAATQGLRSTSVPTATFSGLVFLRVNTVVVDFNDFVFMNGVFSVATDVNGTKFGMTTGGGTGTLPVAGTTFVVGRWYVLGFQNTQSTASLYWKPIGSRSFTKITTSYVETSSPTNITVAGGADVSGNSNPQASFDGFKIWPIVLSPAEFERESRQRAPERPGALAYLPMRNGTDVTDRTGHRTVYSNLGGLSNEGRSPLPELYAPRAWSFIANAAGALTAFYDPEPPPPPPRPRMRPIRALEEGPAWRLTIPPPRPLEALNVEHTHPPMRRSGRPAREDDIAAWSITQPPPQPVGGLQHETTAPTARRQRPPQDDLPPTVPLRAVAADEILRRAPVRASGRLPEEGPAWNITQPPAQPLEGLNLEHPVPPGRRASARREDDPAACNATVTPSQPSIGGVLQEHGPLPVRRPRPPQDEQLTATPPRSLAIEESLARATARRQGRPDEGPAWVQTTPPPQPTGGLMQEPLPQPWRRPNRGAPDEAPPFRVFTPAAFFQSVGPFSDIPAPARIPRVTPQDAQAYDATRPLPLLGGMVEEAPRPRSPARRVDDFAPPMTSAPLRPVVWEDPSGIRRVPPPRPAPDDVLARIAASPVLEPEPLRHPPRRRPPAPPDEPATRAQLAPPPFDVEPSPRARPQRRPPEDLAPISAFVPPALARAQMPDDPGPFTRAWRWLRGLLGFEDVPPTPFVAPTSRPIHVTLDDEPVIVVALTDGAGIAVMLGATPAPTIDAELEETVGLLADLSDTPPIVVMLDDEPT